MATRKKTGGRVKGTPNKVTAQREAEIASSGLTPLDYMLGILRDPGQDQTARFAAAQQAAPYCHAKLAATDVNHSGAVDLTATKEQRDAAVAAALRAKR